MTGKRQFVVTLGAGLPAFDGLDAILKGRPNDDIHERRADGAG